MREGAFVVIDCLGFKGIWKRTDQTLLLEKLKSIMQKVQPQLIAGLPYHLLRKDFIITPSLLSDSVAISLRYEDDATKDKKREQSYLVWLLCASTIKVLDLYLKGEPSLVLRGCITYGEYEHNITDTGSFIVGPAVDDAAENMEVCQGAFVWLHPTAAEKYRYAIQIQMKTIEILCRKNEHSNLLEGSKQSLATPIMVDPYDMPLKNGGNLRCPIINPLAFHETEEEHQAVFRAYEKALSDNQLDVMLKRQHTMDFLRKAKKARADYLAWCAKFIDSLKKKKTKAAAPGK